MADLETVLAAIDELSTDELDEVYRHVMQRRHRNWWIVPPENIAKLKELLRPVHEEAAKMTEEEINDVIDEAIAEVRRERKATRGT
jgi:hypothetical protein